MKENNIIKLNENASSFLQNACDNKFLRSAAVIGIGDSANKIVGAMSSKAENNIKLQWYDGIGVSQGDYIVRSYHLLNSTENNFETIERFADIAYIVSDIKDEVQYNFVCEIAKNMKLQDIYTIVITIKSDGAFNSTLHTNKLLESADLLFLDYDAFKIPDLIKYTLLLHSTFFLEFEELKADFKNKGLVYFDKIKLSKEDRVKEAIEFISSLNIQLIPSDLDIYEYEIDEDEYKGEYCDYYDIKKGTYIKLGDREELAKYFAGYINIIIPPGHYSPTLGLSDFLKYCYEFPIHLVITFDTKLASEEMHLSVFLDVSKINIANIGDTE